jgi:RNA polymerase sigma factor (sigma-70 family)
MEGEHMRSIAALPCSEPPDPCPPSGVQLSPALARTLTAFVHENFERATFWVMRLRVPEPDAEELVQEALIALYERLCRCEDMSSEVWLAWLHTTLRNKNQAARRAYRRRKKHEMLASRRLALQIAPATACPERVLEHRQLVAKVGRFTAELPPERREVVERYLLHNEPMADIAGTLDVSVDTIKTRWLLCIAGVAMTIFTACNWDEGACWIDGQGGGNAGVGSVGSGPIVPAGAGGSGDVPPEPQDATDPPPPDCNIVADSPCNEKCLSDYVAAAVECTKIKDEAQKRSCDDSAYATYKSCRGNCQKQADKNACVLMYDACQDKKGLPCEKEVDGGKTLCAFCLSDCIDKRPYKYSECYQCGFE